MIISILMVAYVSSIVWSLGAEITCQSPIRGALTRAKVGKMRSKMGSELGSKSGEQKWGAKVGSKMGLILRLSY